MVMIKRAAETLEPITVAAGAADADPSYYDVVPKEPTPLLGSWADVWSSRQASEIILEDAEKDGKSAIAPLPSSDDEYQYQQQQQLIAPHNSDGSGDASAVMSPAASFSSDASAGAPLDDACSHNAPAHARHVYRHDPYGLTGAAARTDIFVCTCAACVTANLEAHAEIARRRALARVPPYALSGAAAEEQLHHPHHQQQQINAVEPPSPIKLGASADSALAATTATTTTPTADVEEQPPRQSYTPSFRAAQQQQQQQQQQQRGGFLTHSHVPPPPPHAPRAEVVAFPTSRAASAAAAAGYEVPALPAAIAPHMLSAFMPPPPPSTMTAAVLERDGTAHARYLVEYVAMRWHAKVAATQLYFVAPEDTCPEPAGRDFDEWLQECADWWFRNFEFAQMKPTVYAAAHGYGGNAAYGYNGYGSAPAYESSSYDASGYYAAGGHATSLQEVW